MDSSSDWQCCTVINVPIELPRKPLQNFLCLQGGDNQNACCGGKARENSFSIISETPPHMLPPTGGIDRRTKFRRDQEQAEARKVRLTGGHKSKTLLNDLAPEPLPPMLRRPGEAKYRTRRPLKAREKPFKLPVQDTKYHEELEKCLKHLPFFGKCRYKRSEILRRLYTIKPLRSMLKFGRYYIEKDWRTTLDPRMDPNTLLLLQRKEDRRRKRLRAEGPVSRIVNLFMDKVMGWTISREMQGDNSATRCSVIALLWLGPSLAKKMLNELCLLKDPTSMFQTKSPLTEKEFYIINRLSVDVFFSDKETFYCMLKDYVLSPSLACKMRPCEAHHIDIGSKLTCLQLESKGALTRRVCTHQNLSLSLKPCLVPNCPNYQKPVCEHIYAFIPETISISSYISMLHFVERFQRVEDLKGCIFITKPAYLCNGRGINFLLEKTQFEYFYHMLDGRFTSRHGVLLQRYIECPRLFDQQKFTIRFFLLILVLPKRRVVAFIHYGLAIFCCLPYKPIDRVDFEPHEEALEGIVPNFNVPITCRTIGRVVDDKFNRFIHLSNYYDPKYRSKVKEDIRTGKAVMMELDEDNAFYLEDVLPSKCPNSTSIYIQMLFVAQCIMDYMQPVIQDYPGTFQTISIDSLVDARNKLWVLEAGTKIFSGMLTIAPRQRHMMSVIIQESLGLTIECFYKSHVGLPLYWNYESKCADYDAFYFAQDFNFFYETDITKQSGFTFSRWTPALYKSLEQRYEEVDILRRLAQERKVENEARKKELIRKKLEYTAKVKQKHEEES